LHLRGGVKGIMVNVLVSRVWGVSCTLYMPKGSLNTTNQFTLSSSSPLS